MPDAQKEREDSAKAEADITEAERRVAQQITLIGLMAEKGQETEEATSCCGTTWKPSSTTAGSGNSSWMRSR